MTIRRPNPRHNPEITHWHPEMLNKVGGGSYDGSGSGLSSTTIRDAIDELAEDIAAVGTPDAEDVGVTDSGGFYTGDDVEAILAELPGLFIEKRHGGREVINVVADAGASETLDMADGNFHDVTLTEACTITLDGATAGVLCYASILLRGNFAVTWADTITWLGGSAPSAAALVSVTLFTTDGGTTYIGAHSQGGGGVTDHGALTGLSDDDHTQYLNETRHDALDHSGLPGVGSGGGIGPLLISDSPSTPLVFADLIQNEAQDDLVYADT